MKTTKRYILWILFAVFLITETNAQSVSITIQQPLDFDFLCQHSSNNEHTIKFTVTPAGNIQAGNIFRILLSNDNFGPNTFTIIPNSFINGPTASEYTMKFTLPASTYGTNYKLRVTTSAPAATSTSSNAFDAYNMIHNEEIKLNTASGIDNISFCTGGNVRLFIFNSGNSSSPLFYPQLTYTWKKRVGTVDTVVGTGEFLVVNQPGQYLVETNYGVCTSSSSFFSKSRLVTVTESSASSVIITTNPVTNTICEGSPVLLSLNVSNNSLYTFEWFLNNNPIPNSNSNTYSAVLGGNYHATFNNGSCVAKSNTYTLNPITFNASLNITSPYEVTLGEIVNVIVSTDANSPTYQWFYNNTLLTETTNSINVSQTGNYKALVTQNTGCISTVELPFVLIPPDVDDIPNLISPNGDGVNDIFKLPFALISSNNLSVEIFDSSGKEVFKTTNYQNNWPNNPSELFNSNAFFYYNISKEGDVIKQGILTVIK